VGEERRITPLERLTLIFIKKRFMELLVMEKDIWRQRSHTKWAIEGDRNTLYFHSIATSKKRKNNIQGIEKDDVLYTDQKVKARTFFDFYMNSIGSESARMLEINWSILYPNMVDLNDLSEQISLEEILAAINT
jgi:uncharacterized protein YegL